MQPGQSNVAGAMAFSTSYLMREGQPGLSWNATAELFVNLVDNRRLDSNHFIPIATVLSGLENLATCHSYGRMADECSPPNSTLCPGPDEETLYAKGNAYLAAFYPRMDNISSVGIYCDPIRCFESAHPCAPDQASLPCRPYVWSEPKQNWICPDLHVDTCRGGSAASQGSS
jgi:hypothetical protein